VNVTVIRIRGEAIGCWDEAGRYITLRGIEDTTDPDPYRRPRTRRRVLHEAVMRRLAR
jgi:hypothetical protein